MESGTNEDASRILKGILNIGGPSRTEDEQGPSSTHDDNGRDNRVENGHESPPENSVDTTSVSDHESPSFSLDPVLQQVNFFGDEQQGSVSIYGNEVHITTDELDRQPIAAGSNRIRIIPVVNFDWESKYYNGNLLSVSSEYMAYTLRSKHGFALRILNRKTVQKVLIKGFTGSIEDMAFSHYYSNQLACVDSAGDVFVWTVSDDDDKIIYKLKLHIGRKNEKLPELTSGHRLVWCPYVVDDEENVSEQVFAVSVGGVAEVFHVDMVNNSYGDTVDVDAITNGIVKIQEGHTKFISDIALAPDGSVLATASEDGGVKFWQLDFQSGDPPRCLHEWQPHEGQPVSRLIFCDNHLAQDDKSPFWRFLVTAAKHNSELKIWCTITWSCLQTIRFKLPESDLNLDSPAPALKLKACLDLSARYLVLSDINRKVLYVFLLYQNIDEGNAHVTSVAQFILTQPLLSFVISEAKMFKALLRDSMDQNVDEEGHEEDDEGREDSEEAKPIPTIRIKLHCINPKAMQEMTVQYYPFASVRPVTPSSVAASSMTHRESGVQDGLSDVSGLDTSLTELEDVGPRTEDSQTPELIAPNVFATKIAQPVSQDPPIKPPVHPDPPSVTSSVTSVTSLNNSLPSVRLDQFVGTSQISESSFRTCEDTTTHEQPSMGSNGVTTSWLEHTSPTGPHLPEPPEPAKEPFPVFKTDRQGVNPSSEDDNLSGLTHSTPLRRRTPDIEPDDDADKTPTREDEMIKILKDFSTNFTLCSTLPKQEVEENEIPWDEELGEGLFATGGIGNEDNGVGDGELEIAKEAAEASLQSPVPHEADDDTSTARQSYEKQPQRKQQSFNLTVTPRRQIDIQPEETTSAKEPSRSDAALNEIRSEVRQLRELLQYQQQEHSVKVSEVLREEVAILEGAMTEKLGAMLAQHAAEQEHMIERFARDKQANEKQRHDKMATSITTAVLNKVEKTVKNEIRNSVNSGFQKLIHPLQDQLDTVMSQKLTVANEVLKETIDRMVTDKSIVDALGKAIDGAIQVTFSTNMVEFLNKSLLPGFERACRNMYAQINTAFENGTKQYIQNFEKYAENRKDIEKQQKDTIVEQLQILVQNFQDASEKLSTSMSGSLLEMMQTQLTNSMKRLQSSLLAQLQEDLNKSLQETIQREIPSALIEQNVFDSINESRSQAEQKKAQARIEKLISERDFTEAFQEALTAADLNLVVMVCQSCDPQTLFAQEPCPLGQPILLSLIQQLSVDLSTDTELKHKYLDEAIVALDTNDPITREHVAAILEGLCEQLGAQIRFLSQNDPTNPLQRSLKRLLMAAKSLLK